MQNIFLDINHNISEILNSFVLNNNLEKAIGIISDLPIFFLPVFLVGTWLFYTFKNKNPEKKKDLLNIVYGIILAIIINIIIQKIFFFERPESLIKPILDHIPDASFPSDHAAVSFAFLTGLFLAGYKKIGYIFLIFAVAMNLSRVAGGVHWFFDIIAGIVVGFISEIFIFKNKKSQILEKTNNFILKIMNFIKL